MIGSPFPHSRSTENLDPLWIRGENQLKCGWNCKPSSSSKRFRHLSQTPNFKFQKLQPLPYKTPLSSQFQGNCEPCKQAPAYIALEGFWRHFTSQSTLQASNYKLPTPKLQAKAYRTKTPLCFFLVRKCEPANYAGCAKSYGPRFSTINSKVQLQLFNFNLQTPSLAYETTLSSCLLRDTANLQKVGSYWCGVSLSLFLSTTATNKFLWMISSDVCSCARHNSVSVNSGEEATCAFALSSEKVPLLFERL